MAEALAHLHEHGIAHLDVKPDNIYTTPAGVLKLGDFGLATPLGGGGACTLAPDEGDSRRAIPLLIIPCTALSRTPNASRRAYGATEHVLRTPAGPRPGRQHVSSEGRSAGDGRYLAPELLANDWAAPEKADMFALGASAYELATGQDLPASAAPARPAGQPASALSISFTKCAHAHVLLWSCACALVVDMTRCKR
jgi:serine/threonine protein kinase